jgi:hypothetical protein
MAKIGLPARNLTLKLEIPRRRKIRPGRQALRRLRRLLQAQRKRGIT